MCFLTPEVITNSRVKERNTFNIVKQLPNISVAFSWNNVIIYGVMSWNTCVIDLVLVDSNPTTRVHRLITMRLLPKYELSMTYIIPANSFHRELDITFYIIKSINLIFAPSHILRTCECSYRANKETILTKSISSEDEKACHWKFM